MERKNKSATVDQSRALAEASREKSWRGQSFLRDLFLGDYRLDLLESLHLGASLRPEFWTFYESLKSFLRDHVDPSEIDTTGEYPPVVIQGLAELGAFGMKIPGEYGGLGFTHAEYVRVMELVGSYDANVTALLSAHQAIGVPQPIMMFGTEEQKRRFLPRCAKGSISAFALTEPAVGSDPARLATVAESSADGEHFILSGAKLWCTNGTLAELIVVMARDPRSERINAFVVEMDSPGVIVERRCHFMGLRALANAVVRFDQVRVPRDNLIGRPGDGLKIALATLNTGRLSLPAATAGLAMHCTEIVRKWSRARVQWGQPIGQHEAIAHHNAEIATSAFAMESVAQVVGASADRKDLDIRLEAAAAKEWNTTRAWRVVDKTLQVRGGRGYETEKSLAARGEAPIGVERSMRDARINLIFEGTSEIMHLFMARESIDKHLEIAGSLVDPKVRLRDKLAALPRIMLFYVWWYPSRWLGWSLWPRYRRSGALGTHLRFAHRASRRLSRAVFHGMLRYGGALERKQAFLFRAIDIAMEIFVLSATIVRAQKLAHAGSENAESAAELAELFARRSRRTVQQLFRDLWRNDDSAQYRVGRKLLEGRYSWLGEAVMPLAFEEADLVPLTMDEILMAPLKRQEAQPHVAPEVAKERESA